jgi:hypothetical protein
VSLAREARTLLESRWSQINLVSILDNIGARESEQLPEIKSLMVATVSRRCFYFLSERAAMRDSGLCFWEQISAPRENVIRLQWWPDRDRGGPIGGRKKHHEGRKKSGEDDDEKNTSIFASWTPRCSRCELKNNREQ